MMSLTSVMAQNALEMISQRAITKGFVLLRQDYVLMNEEDEPVNLKEGETCNGSGYTCAVRVSTANYLLNRDFTKPWSAEKALPKNSTNHYAINYTGYRELNSTEFEEIDADPETADNVVENHLSQIEASEIEGFEIDECYGKKRGFAVWLVSDKAFGPKAEPGKLSIDIKPMNITTRENNQVYDLTQQPTGNVLGGAFLVPTIQGLGKIIFRVNGVFEKVGGVWKLISLGTDEPDDEDQLWTSSSKGARQNTPWVPEALSDEEGAMLVAIIL